MYFAIILKYYMPAQQSLDVTWFRRANSLIIAQKWKKLYHFTQILLFYLIINE